MGTIRFCDGSRRRTATERALQSQGGPIDTLCEEDRKKTGRSQVGRIPIQVGMSRMPRPTAHPDLYRDSPYLLIPRQTNLLIGSLERLELVS